jgi:hypothetical protein
MRDDTLLRWFYKLRSEILKGIDPLIGIVLGSVGREDLWPGAITVSDRPLPDVHRGQAIPDPSVIDLCRLYVTYLEELVDSGAVVIWEVHDRHIKSTGPQA